MVCCHHGVVRLTRRIAVMLMMLGGSRHDRPQSARRKEISFVIVERKVVGESRSARHHLRAGREVVDRVILVVVAVIRRHLKRRLLLRLRLREIQRCVDESANRRALDRRLAVIGERLRHIPRLRSVGWDGCVWVLEVGEERHDGRRRAEHSLRNWRRTLAGLASEMILELLEEGFVLLLEVLEVVGNRKRKLLLERLRIEVADLWKEGKSVNGFRPSI